MNIEKDRKDTIEYYEKNAEGFVERTFNVDFSETQERFAKQVRTGGLVLDFGCGSGRDTKWFLDKGFRVEAIDGCETLCDIASKNTGISVKHMFFNELDEQEKYDGIWACSSILHCPKDELTDVFKRMILATVPGGFLYVSFKYGTFEGIRYERHFTDFNEESFSKYTSQFAEVSIIDEWVTSDVRPGRGEEKWLNIILKKSDTI